MAQRKQIAEFIEKYGYELKYLPNDLRKNLTVHDKYSKETIEIPYGRLVNKINNKERKTVEEHEYTNTVFYKFRERFNLKAEFFSDRNLEQLKVDSRKLFAKLNKKNAFTHHINRINDLIPFITAIETAMPTLGKIYT